MSAAAVSGYLDRVAATLRDAGRTERADELARLAAAPRRQKPAVFVVGEDKEGKSFLVNALLQKPDLSPVGVEVVTGAPITFFHRAEPAALVYNYGEPQPKPAEFDAARRLATVAGNPRNVNNVRAVALGTDSPLLASLNLIDTPGVGGLASGHGALTLQSLHAADALIFVIEAGSQFRAAELDFLRRAAARIDSVILVLTKIDVHRGWRTILADNEAILREQAPRFAGCPVVPVSSLLALRALASDDPDEAAALREESGLPELERAIVEQVVSRAAVLRDANLVRAAAGAIVEVERGARERIAAIAAGDGTRQALEAERRRLAELRQDRAEWPRRLSSEVHKLTLERSEAAARATLEIKSRYDERLKQAPPEEFDVMPGELVADLTALAGSLNEAATERLGELVGELLDEIDEGSALKEAIGELAGHSLRNELEAVPIGDYEMTQSDKLSVLVGFVTGRSLGMMAGMAAGAAMTGPVGLVLGFGAGGLFAFEAFRTRRQQAFSTAFQSWMQAQIARTQVTINSGFSRSMVDLQTQIREEIQAALVRREREIAESLAATEKLAEAEAGRRGKAERELGKRVEALRALRGDGATLLSELTRASAAGQAPAATPAAG